MGIRNFEVACRKHVVIQTIAASKASENSRIFRGPGQNAVIVTQKITLKKMKLPCRRVEKKTATESMDSLVLPVEEINA